MECFGLHLNKASLKNGVSSKTPLTALAFFLGQKESWRSRKYTPKQIQTFRETLERCPNLSSEQIVVHGSYLINPASETEGVAEKSIKMFVEELKFCDELNVGNYVFHPGTYKSEQDKTRKKRNPKVAIRRSVEEVQEGLQAVVDMIKVGLAETSKVKILVENMTKSNFLCQSWEECRWIIDQVNDPRVGICLDTAHCWGAGAVNGMNFDSLLDDFDRIVGIKNLGAIHLNDSKADYGGNKDLHEDILVGKIPHQFWNDFIFDPRIKRIPAILETPSNCHSVVKMIVENGCVPNTGKKEYVNVRVKPSISDFFKPRKSKKENKTMDRRDHLNNVFIKDVTNIILGFLSDYERLDEFIPSEWATVLLDDVRSKYFYDLTMRLEADALKHRIFPPVKKIFRALELCPPNKVKVCLIGQDPYHGKGQAEGLSFSVQKGVRVPPSLKNMYKELKDDIKGYKPPYHGSLVRWAEQGVLLLNASLTVQEKKANSHKDYGWQKFTDAILRWIDQNREDVVFILMGKFAQKKCEFVDEDKHYVIKTIHPSPLAGNKFLGSKPFSKCNQYLKNKGMKMINWQN